jgi:ABC-type nitrate/sulfonate/bicarbonate transport system substrate-binding protein
MPFSEMPAALINGRVDAASIQAINDPDAGKPNDPLRQIASTFDALAPRFITSVWFSTREWVESHKAEARALVSVLRETAIWANTHHKESARVLTGFTHQTADSIESSTRTTYGERLSAEMMQPSIDAAARYGLIKRPFAANEIMSNVA